jgi:hypothetical protein
MRRVILWEMAGRRPNMELQWPFIERILQQHSSVEVHVWNMARNPADNDYLQTLSSDRVTVLNDVYALASSNEMLACWEVWRHYAAPQYQACLFIKIDDDVVFLQTGRFPAFLTAVDTCRGAVVSANIINNEACQHADLAHNYFFDHYTEMLDQPVELIPTEDWLSINCIGYDWRTGCRIAEQLGGPHPSIIAGREWEPSSPMGDEGMANMLSRIIVRGFLAAHLTFGSQEHAGIQAFGSQQHAENLKSWRLRYHGIGQRYLEGSER